MVWQTFVLNDKRKRFNKKHVLFCYRKPAWDVQHLKETKTKKRLRESLNECGFFSLKMRPNVFGKGGNKKCFLLFSIAVYYMFGWIYGGPEVKNTPKKIT